MFEKATRLALRFSSKVGHISTEDLWNLPLTARNKNSACLDDVARAIYAEMKDHETVSFVTESTGPDNILQLKMDIVKHIIKIKLAEAQAARTDAENKTKREKLMRIIAEKKDTELYAKSTEELEAMLSSM